MLKTSFTHYLPLSISNNQIYITDQEYDEHCHNWGKGNLKQGLIWNDNYIVFDPLVDGDLSAIFVFETLDQIKISPDAQRAIKIPFNITNTKNFRLETVSDCCYLSIPAHTQDIEKQMTYGKYFLNSQEPFLTAGSYTLLFQICVGDIPKHTDGEEVYYKLSFISSDKNEKSEGLSLMDDAYGLKKQQKINPGQF